MGEKQRENVVYAEVSDTVPALCSSTSAGKEALFCLRFRDFYHLTVNSNELHQWKEYERVKVHSVIVENHVKSTGFNSSS